jgi:hypothetical protein
MESVFRLCLWWREDTSVVLSITGCVGVLLDCFGKLRFPIWIGVTSTRGWGSAPNTLTTKLRPNSKLVVGYSALGNGEKFGFRFTTVGTYSWPVSTISDLSQQKYKTYIAKGLIFIALDPHSIFLIARSNSNLFVVSNHVNSIPTPACLSNPEVLTRHISSTHLPTRPPV